MTVLELLKATEQMLNNVRVPVALKESVADPLYQACVNIADCVRTIEEDAKKKAEKTEDAENDKTDAE